MTTLPKLRVPPETATVPILPHDSSPPKRSKTVIGLRDTSHSLDGTSTRSAAVFPWLRTDLTDSKPTLRSDLLRPAREKTFALSSTYVNFKQEMETLRKKREQYQQFHRNWMRPFYGSKIDQEEYRTGIRKELKNQMMEKDSNIQQFLKDKVKESTQAFTYDQECINKDKAELKDKAIYLRNFRDGNKKIIEERERMRREDRISTAAQEQKLLRQSPVNWSKTLR